MFLVDGLAFGGEPLDMLPDELLQVTFALGIEVSADPVEFVRPVFSTSQCELASHAFC